MVDKISEIIKNVDIQNKTFVAEMPNNDIKPILNETPGVEPQILNIETSDAFVSIDIDKL